MANEQKGSGQEQVKVAEKLPLGQVLFDDMFLLLALGLGLPLVTYIVWALIDLGRVPSGMP